MSQTPVTVTYPLEEILARIEGKVDDLKKDVGGKLDGLKSDVNDLKVGQARIEERLTAVEKDITDLKGSQKAQIWTLIGVLGTAVVGTVIRFVITALPGNP